MDEEYYDSLITGGRTGAHKKLTTRLLKFYITKGLSSVKIAKQIGCSYCTVLNYTDRYAPSYSKKLRDNGKRHQIRRAKDAPKLIG